MAGEIKRASDCQVRSLLGKDDATAGRRLWIVGDLLFRRPESTPGRPRVTTSPCDAVPGTSLPKGIAMTSDHDGYVIFRRFRRTRDGKVLDAWQYGLKAWPIRVRGSPRKSK